MDERPLISVVIPTYNEAKALPYTLRQLALQQASLEVIVADGGSTDETVDAALAFDRVQIVRAPKGRASQMNAGARVARGDWLLFLHADTALPEGALARLDRVDPRVGFAAGGFRQRFTGSHWQLRAISWLHNTRCRFTGIFYGDQAFFVRRDLFWSLGGFPDTPILEDVLFSERVRRVTTPRLLKEYVLTDSRKFEQRGIARSFVRVLVILACHELKLPVRARAFFDDVR
jgi:rSAM/selenodomain-associated transferase 2